jgi:hypothetical protein
MSYTITIEETKTVCSDEQGAYCQDGREFISAQEYEALDFDDRKRFNLQADGMYARDTYSYPPKRTVVKQVSIKVYEQVVDTLDINLVILAVIKPKDVPV